MPKNTILDAAVEADEINNEENIENEDIKKDTEDIEEVDKVEEEETLEGETNKKPIGKFRKFLMTTLNGMTLGLFATLIIGTIVQQIGIIIGNNVVGNFIQSPLATTLKAAMGIGIGIGVALSMEMKGMKLIVSGIIGAIASSFKLQFIGNDKPLYQPLFGEQLGALRVNLDPLTIYLVVVLGVLLLDKIFKKKTFLDILIIPLGGILIAAVLTYVISGPAGVVIYYVSRFVDISTRAVPFIMTIVISVIMGMLLTAPISSAAIALMITIGNNPVAAAAAVVGTSVQMVGFAIQSLKDNKAGTIVSISIGTSMLQFKNIIKKPVIWLPTIIASAILGPFVLLFNLPYEAATSEIAAAWSLGAGMGTSGLVGQFQTVAAMGASNWQTWIYIFILQIIAPAILVFGIDMLFRKLKWIKPGDLEV